MECIYRDRGINKANDILAHKRHPTVSSIELLPSGQQYCPLDLLKTHLH